MGSSPVEVTWNLSETCKWQLLQLSSKREDHFSNSSVNLTSQIIYFKLIQDRQSTTCCPWHSNFLGVLEDVTRKILVLYLYCCFKELTKIFWVTLKRFIMERRGCSLLQGSFWQGLERDVYRPFLYTTVNFSGSKWIEATCDANAFSTLLKSYPLANTLASD